MIDRHPWILLVSGTAVLGTVLFGVAFGAPPVVDDLVAFLLRPRPVSIVGILGFAILWHRLVTYLDHTRNRRRARRKVDEILARHDRRNA